MREVIGMKYNCSYVSGGGEEYEEGIFELQTKTKKYLILQMIEPGFFANYPDIKTRKIPLVDNGAKRTKFCPAVKFWGDGSFTVYHNADGTPYIYTPEIMQGIAAIPTPAAR